ncbi:hypothetical protein LAUMK42_04413 [Mycobacterium persicum]|uniref:Uncharacterized protein n=1 Tax=Mycobacterium persicum TaxID=1487726 RepID=A0AB38V0M3_9MYCO|nr:hypothetical protein B1T49_08630 [Mycobacterium persicum]VAZ85575.1 hypothetical protein LAUMK42_04413 [Mycobacterium persicum]
MPVTIEATPDSQRLQFLDDYCPRCNPAGDQADSRVRSATLTEPVRLTWPGGKYVTCDYQCHGCGHQWRRADYWTARSAGFDRKQRRRAA